MLNSAAPFVASTLERIATFGEKPPLLGGAEPSARRAAGSLSAPNSRSVRAPVSASSPGSQSFVRPRLPSTEELLVPQNRGLLRCRGSEQRTVRLPESRLLYRRPPTLCRRQEVRTGNRTHRARRTHHPRTDPRMSGTAVHPGTPPLQRWPSFIQVHWLNRHDLRPSFFCFQNEPKRIALVEPHCEDLFLARIVEA